MVWAKSHQPVARYNLALSGLAPPGGTPGLAAVNLDLAQRGQDMPPKARSRLAERFGVAPERVMLTLGTSHAVYLLCASQLSAGDCVLVERPCYEMLRGVPPLFGARVERFERRLEDGYALPADLCERVRSLRPRLVLLTNPHNPSGAYLLPEALHELATAVASVEGLLVVDEVYLEYLDEAPSKCAAHLGDAVAGASSFTKAFGLGTVRFGWIVASESTVARALSYNNFISVLYPNPLAAVGLAALEQLDALQERTRKIRAAGAAVLDAWLASRRDIVAHREPSAVITFARVDGLRDARRFVEVLLDERETLAVPGDFFESPGHLRLGFGIDVAQLSEGLKRLGHALDRI